MFNDFFMLISNVFNFHFLYIFNIILKSFATYGCCHHCFHFLLHNLKYMCFHPSYDYHYYYYVVCINKCYIC